MKKFLLILLLHLTGGVLYASGYELSSEEALQAVANHRALNNDPGRYYFAPTDTVINNRDCTVDSLPAGITWLADNTPKWLVFVDEQPGNHAWSHPCMYYYVPRFVSNASNVPVFGFDGNFIPHINNLALADSSIIQTPDSPIVFPTFTVESGGIIEPNASKFHAVIIGGGTSKSDNYASIYNDTKYLYNVLTKKYGIPKINIHVLLGSGGYYENDLEHYFEGEHETYTTMPLDLDDDGSRDILGPFFRYSIDSLFTSLATNLTEDNYLLVVVNAHGAKPEDNNGGDIGLYGGDMLTKNQLRAYLDSIHVASQVVLLSTCYSGNHINTLKNKDNRIIITSTKPDQFENKSLHSYFLHCFTNALNGKNCKNEMVFADSTANGWISIEEAFNYAKWHYKTDYNPEHQTPYNSFNEELNVIPQYFARCPRLGEDFAINHLPDPTALYIRDRNNDTGMDGLYEYRQNPWRSPDIWVRNNNDGLANTYSEPLQVSAEDNKVYIYTRIHNRGWKPYNGQGRYLHLHWAPTALRHTPSEWVNTFPTSTYPELGIIPITPIDTLGSTIISYEWTVPQSVVNQAIQNGGNLNADFLARISDSPNTIVNDNTNLLYPYKYTGARSVLKESTLAALNVVKNTSSNQSLSVVLPFMVTDNETDSISVGLNELTTNNLPDGVSLWLELTPALAWACSNDSTATQVNLTQAEPYCTFRGLTPGIHTVTAHLDINPNNVVQTEQYTIPLNLAHAQEILGGVSLEASIAPRNNPLDPGIEDDGGGSAPGGDDAGDGGEEGINRIGQRLLSLSGVDEPVTCQWIAPSGETIASGDTLLLPLYARGEYSLHVTALSDGAKATTKKMISPLLKIDDIDCGNNGIAIHLSLPATNSLRISLRPTTGGTTPIVYPCVAGEKQLTIPNCPSSGLYLITLLDGTNVIETRQVMIP